MHAGDVGDGAFYSMVERKLVDEDAYRTAGVLDWFRFRDDMLLTATDVPAFMTLLERMHSLSAFFKINVEIASTVAVRFLDIVVQRGGKSFT